MVMGGQRQDEQASCLQYLPLRTWQMRSQGFPWLVQLGQSRGVLSFALEYQV